jgi:hypothetical protein
MAPFFALEIYGQPMPNMNNDTLAEHAVHSIDNLVISENIPLTGKLAIGDYLLLMDLTPFATSVEGHSHIALKVPCNDDGTSKLTVVTGIAPKLNSLPLGNPIMNGTLDEKNFTMSKIGESCLYHSDLPNGVNDIVAINTLNETLDFQNGGYSATITVHGAAVQHGDIPPS